jgi:hypothetical protein
MDPFETQNDNPGAWVGVREGLHADTNTPITEFVVQDKQNGDHAHLGIDLNGNEVFRRDDVR